MLSESAARWLLVLHTALGVAAVGAATHLVIWMRGYLRGQHGRRRAVRRFAWISLALHAAAFLAGNAVYPTYRVEVRAAYLDNAGAITAERAARQRELERIAAREGSPAPVLAPASEQVRAAGKAARWFDVKEHWVALGLLASLGLVLVLALWDPRTGSPAIAPAALGLAIVIAGTVWLGAIVGVLTSSWRAV
ncbi:MAG TPA: hypothetical protein VK932_10815 [Kofleriaceae bacterium]|nr:hypothetical protein [Kofleriaceae bacterium]